MPGIAGCLSVRVTELPGSRSCRDVTRAWMHPCHFSPASWLQVEKNQLGTSFQLRCSLSCKGALHSEVRPPSPLSYQHAYTLLPSYPIMQPARAHRTLAAFAPLALPWDQHISKPLTDIPNPGGQPPPVNLRLGTSSFARQGDEGKLYFPQEGLEPKSRFMILHYSKKKKKKRTVFSPKIGPILLFCSGSGAMPSFLGHCKGHIVQGLADSGSTKSSPRERKLESHRVTDCEKSFTALPCKEMFLASLPLPNPCCNERTSSSRCHETFVNPSRGCRAVLMGAVLFCYDKEGTETSLMLWAAQKMSKRVSLCSVLQTNA